MGRERESEREQQQDFSTSHGETRAQDLAIHIIFVFSNRSVHPSAEVPIKIKLKKHPHLLRLGHPQLLLLVLGHHNNFFLSPTTTSSWTSFNHSPKCRVPSRKRSC